jgi:hypothetical protein
MHATPTSAAKKQKTQASTQASSPASPARGGSPTKRSGPVTRALIANPHKMAPQIARLKQHALKLLPATLTYIFNRAKHAVVGGKRAPAKAIDELLDAMDAELSSNPATAAGWDAIKPFAKGDKELGECCCVQLSDDSPLLVACPATAQLYRRLYIQLDLQHSRHASQPQLCSCMTKCAHNCLVHPLLPMHQAQLRSATS